MKFYLASGFANKDLVRSVSDKLKRLGHLHTYDWTRNERALTVEDLQHIGKCEKDAIINSDVVIILLPGGKGSHVELGIALGLRKRIILYSQDDVLNDIAETTTFYHLPEVEKCSGDIEKLVDYVLALY
ncbi:nucleoside 2-deoxyribosyltransferase [Rossellomorea aquimaris]|uniref:nucleoside 2-deoxyribosyltransferase n=1 Tax=Rossellomorea TaxID=2837508 RepID=UPI001CD3A9CE|nr:nucleoside 2-deoxyribosyltransferase [Rossellomorea aquimaris]MCA1058892.1 nucleoside 2-deoxyribosyltransferase [Rossellomorea aquimaris]